MKNHRPLLRPLIVAAGLLLPNFVVAQVAASESEAATNSIVIRAGEEWVREYPASRIEIQLVTRPYFATLSKALPIMEVGGMGLTFVREGDGGAMILFGKEKLLLPRLVEVDPVGRSLDPLAIKLQFDRGAGVSRLYVDSWAFTVAADPVAEGARLPVVIAAGAEMDWIVDSFRVVADDGTSHDWNAFTRGLGDSPGSAVSESSASRVDPTQSNEPSLGGSVGLDTSDVASDLLEAHQPFRPKNREEWDDARTAAWDDAIRHFKAGEYSMGEQVLTRILANRRGTAGWHHELAVRLFNAALYLREIGDATVAHEVGKCALRHVEFVQGSTRLQDRARYIARAGDLGGRIYEVLYQDHRAALQFYQLAAHHGDDRAAHAISRVGLYSKE